MRQVVFTDDKFGPARTRKLRNRLHTHRTLPTLQVGLNAKALTCGVWWIARISIYDVRSGPESSSVEIGSACL
jgi:hypothetical protein